MSRLLFIAGLALAVLVAQTPRAQAIGIGDLKKKVKQKLEEKAEKKQEEVADSLASKAEGTVTGRGGSQAKQGGAQNSSSKGPGTTVKAGQSAASGTGGPVAEVSPKYDYVPGDKVIFAEDFAGDAAGASPKRWAKSGTAYRVSDADGTRWLEPKSDGGWLKVNVPGGLPYKWTFEFDFRFENGGAPAIAVRADAGATPAWTASWPQGGGVALEGSGLAAPPAAAGGALTGTHHIAFLASGPALKIYVDHERIASVPEIAWKSEPQALSIRLSNAAAHPAIANMRFAEGAKSAGDQLAAGTLVTHGVQFGRGSDAVKIESAPTLRQVAAYLGANSAAKLLITVYADDAGSFSANGDLSKKRAAAVKNVLVSQFGVAGDRLTTAGKGDAEPLAPATTPEGRAVNRRVVFSKS